MLNDESPNEPRVSPRQRSLMGAVLSFNNGMSTVDCLIRNMSESGARLSVSPSVSLPAAVRLQIPKKGIVRETRVVWRSEDEVGVVFARPPAGEKDPNNEGALKRRIRELEREVTQLRTRINELSGG